MTHLTKLQSAQTWLISPVREFSEFTCTVANDANWENKVHRNSENQIKQLVCEPHLHYLNPAIVVNLID